MGCFLVDLGGYYSLQVNSVNWSGRVYDGLFYSSGGVWRR